MSGGSNLIKSGNLSSQAVFSADSTSYIQAKLKKWYEENGSVRKHAGILGGRNKLKLEFFEDFTAELQPVCRDIQRLGYARSRAEILKIIESEDIRVSSAPFFGTVDVILSGLSDACGFRRKGDDLDWW